MLRTSSLLPVVGFLYRHYRYKSLATDILHDLGLASIPYTGLKSLPHRGSASHSAVRVERIKPRYHGVVIIHLFKGVGRILSYFKEGTQVKVI